MRSFEIAAECEAPQSNTGRCGIKQVVLLVVLALALLLLGLYLRDCSTQSRPSPTPLRAPAPASPEAPTEEDAEEKAELQWTENPAASAAGLDVVKAACDSTSLPRKSDLSTSISRLRKQFEELPMGVTKELTRHSKDFAQMIEECWHIDFAWVAWGSSAREVPCAAAGTKTSPDYTEVQELVADATKESCKGQGGVLMKQIIEEAKKEGKYVAINPSLDSRDEEGRKKLAKFYETLGFKPKCPAAGDQKGCLDAFVWTTQ